MRTLSNEEPTISRRRLDKGMIHPLTKTLIVGSLTLVAAIGVLGFAYYLGSHVLLQWQVESQIGFSYDTPRREGREVFLITRVAPDMAMDRAGVKVGDYVRFRSVDTLYHLLVSNQDRDVMIPLERDKKPLAVTVRVPHLDLWISPEMILWADERLPNY